MLSANQQLGSRLVSFPKSGCAIMHPESNSPFTLSSLLTKKFIETTMRTARAVRMKGLALNRFFSNSFKFPIKSLHNAYLSLLFLLAGLLAVIGPVHADNNALLSMFKGIEIWSWEGSEGGRKYVTLAGTNRSKSCEEIFSAKAKDIEELEAFSTLNFYWRVRWEVR